jgi:hypothetical protein
VRFDAQIRRAELRLTTGKGSFFDFTRRIARMRNHRTLIPSSIFGCAGNVQWSTHWSMQTNLESCSRIALKLPRR